MIISIIKNNLYLIVKCRKGIAVSTLLQWLLIIGGGLALLALLGYVLWDKLFTPLNAGELFS